VEQAATAMVVAMAAAIGVASFFVFIGVLSLSLVG